MLYTYIYTSGMLYHAWAHIYTMPGHTQEGIGLTLNLNPENNLGTPRRTSLSVDVDPRSQPCKG